MNSLSLPLREPGFDELDAAMIRIVQIEQPAESAAYLRCVYSGHPGRCQAVGNLYIRYFEAGMLSDSGLRDQLDIIAARAGHSHISQREFRFGGVAGEHAYETKLVAIPGHGGVQ